MSYSRWGESHWYTYWTAGKCNRDTARFEICGVASFSAMELRKDLDGCLNRVREIDGEGDIEELREYALEFLEEVGLEFAATTDAIGHKDACEGVSVEVER